MSTTVVPTPGTSTIPSPTPAPITVNPTVASGGPVPGAGAAATTDWTTGFDDETKGYIQNKGFKSPQDLLGSYRNFEKLQGVPQDRILKLPENFDSPEGRAILERLGTPKEAKDYGVAIPPENGDPNLAEFMSKTFLEAGVTKSMASKIVEKWNEYQGGNRAAQAETMKAKFAEADKALRTEWGAAFDQNKNVVDSAARTLGMSKEELGSLGMALGPDKAMKLLHKLGTSLGEHTFVAGKAAANTILDPNQAKSKIDELRSNSDFVQRLASGDKKALSEWTRAHEMAAPGEINF